MLYFAASILLFSTSTLGQDMSLSCPNAKAVDNFDFNRFKEHTWYQVARYPNAWEDGQSCNTMAFNSADGVDHFKISGTRNKRLEDNNGFIEPGSEGVVNCFSANYIATTGSYKLPITVVAVDYNKYMIGYTCGNNEVAGTHNEFAWIMTRSKEIDMETLIRINKYLESSKVIDQNRLFWIDHSNEACKVE